MVVVFRRECVLCGRRGWAPSFWSLWFEDARKFRPVCADLDGCKLRAALRLS